MEEESNSFEDFKQPQGTKKRKKDEDDDYAKEDKDDDIKQDVDTSSEFDEQKYLETKEKRINYLKPKVKTRSKMQQDKILTCNICQKEFTNKDNMKKHVNAVHMIKEFSCNECGKIYSRANTLKGHINVVHKGKCYIFTYENCKDSFLRKDDLNLHLLGH